MLVVSNILSGFAVAAFNSGNVAQAYLIAIHRIMKHYLFLQLVFAAVRNVDMQHCFAIGGCEGAAGGAQTLCGKLGEQCRLADVISCKALKVNRYGYLFVLAAEYLEVAKFTYLAEPVGELGGVVLKLAWRALGALYGEQHTRCVTKVIDDNNPHDTARQTRLAEHRQSVAYLAPYLVLVGHLYSEVGKHVGYAVVGLRVGGLLVDLLVCE